MNRPISTKIHGVIDYTWATIAGTLPKMMNGATETSRLVRGAATAAGFNSMVTDYEAGVVRVMPMKGHLAVDFVMGAVLILSPFYLPRAERRFVAIPVVLGLAGLVTSLLTTTEPWQADDTAFTPSHELSEAVADPDLARSPYLRAHIE